MDWQQRFGNYLESHGPALIGGLVILIAGFVVSGWLAKLARRWLERKPMEPPIRMLFVRILRLLLLLLAGVIALGTAGVEITPLVAGIGVAGVGVGLATQGVLANLFAGLLIIFTKPYRVGEYIDLLGEEGLVTQIELFNTTLAHPDRSRVIIPNRRIIGEILHNYGTTRQLDLTVGIAYDSDLPRALAAIRRVLDRNPRVLKDPAPVVGVSGLGDSSINIAVKPWTAPADFGAAGAEIYQAIVEEFRVEGISIPFPQREIRLLNPGTGGAA
ncbi:MAG TPA: mechanosensitive ion channel family protein [Methylomirabilota bacterium]|nr:mechanosensitive ion channel family protein [Methylomirabilota bacterium]